MMEPTPGSNPDDLRDLDLAARFARFTRPEVIQRWVLTFVVVTIALGLTVAFGLW
jgi:hypothetical protein